ncbi:MAG: 50S ribosomal protein L15 [Sphaerobacteraceae bacterium]|nr:MAG: 50S ribosomal protein L15 [Sphaerobacteraceae bacterium]
MELHDLKPSPGSRKARKRVGRGIAGGQGKTAGRGTKGQLARSKVRVGFEGGQNPIFKRMPFRRGFTNIFKVQYEVINVQRLAAIESDGPITPELLVELGITRGPEYPVKILGVGEIDKAITVHAHKFSESARSKIEAAGGTVEVID